MQQPTLYLEIQLSHPQTVTAAVNFAAGTKNVFCTLPASKAVILDSSGNIVANNGTNLTALRRHTIKLQEQYLTQGFLLHYQQQMVQRLTDLNASNLASGTLPDARFPATLTSSKWFSTNKFKCF
jgi:hypothetical protein